MPHLKYALLCLSALIVAACGGGGGGGGGSSSSTSSTPASTATVVTESNRNAVASSTIAATGVAVATTDAGYGLMFRSASKAGPVAMPGVFQLALAQVQQLNNQPEAEKKGLRTTSCIGGGSITTTSQASSSLYYTIGDTWAITYSACDMGNGYSMTGKISGTVSASSSSSSSGTLGVSINFTNYAFTLNGDSLPSLTYNGDVAMTAHFVGQRVASASLTSSSFSLISKNYSLSIKNMASEASGLDTSSATYSVSCSFSEGVSGQNIAGTITTITPLVADVNGKFSSGKLRFTGNNSAAFLTFKAGNVVTLELDTNGDNVVDHAWETSITEINQ